MSKLFRRENGRQELGLGGYVKMPLWRFKILRWGFDAYIIKFKPHTVIPPHKDEVKDGKHWRLNITLKGIFSFGMLKDNKWFLTHKRVVKFRPDLYLHRFLVYHKKVIMLSFGFVNFKKK